MRANVTKSGLALLALLMFGLLVAGCYTVLVHPTVETTGDNQTPRTCADCHSSADYYYWHFPYQYNWYSRYPSWNRYYHDPWWYDNYWYWKDDGSGGTGAPQGHLWQPRVAPGSEPTIAPGTSGTPANPNKSSDQGSGSGDKKEPAKEKQQLFQPRVPPKDSDDKSDKSDKSDSPSQEQSEGR
jgi:hypothetical protein